ncbi:MAG: hypothetical protein DMG57_11970 [Acidobacteria bacterium]|nr:MAG: hypothetical protein DMG57_11970 [Acidobacteriota bacterium]
MIEKFNFYDIYGYFLPGAAFLAVLWAPFGLVRKSWPSSDWTSAIIAAAFAYILGHLIQSVVTNAIPSREVTLGLILCAEKYDAVVKFKLGRHARRKIFASRYKLHLPTERELKTEIKRELLSLRGENLSGKRIIK